MQKPRYALVAYLNNPTGEFVENLRRELHPDLPHLAAHLTILPPRPLQGTESDALQVLDRICGHEEPFEVTLGDVACFAPVTPTVYIRVDVAAARMSELHRKLDTEALAFKEEWPYTPHLTIVKMGTEPAAQSAFQTARARWSKFSGSRRILLERLTFVREDVREDVRDDGPQETPKSAPSCWVDLASVILGRNLVTR